MRLVIQTVCETDAQSIAGMPEKLTVTSKPGSGGEVNSVMNAASPLTRYVPRLLPMGAAGRRGWVGGRTTRRGWEAGRVEDGRLKALAIHKASQLPDTLTHCQLAVVGIEQDRRVCINRA